MEDKVDTKFKINRIGKDAPTLYNNGKVLEAFALAEHGEIASVETVEGQWYAICKVEKLEELLQTVAKQAKTEIEYIESEGVNLQLDGE